MKTLRHPLFLGMMLVLAVGCAEEDRAPTSTAEQPVAPVPQHQVGPGEAVPQPAVKPATEPFDPVREEALKRGIETRVSPVDFGAASSLPKVVATIPEEQRARLASVPLPVLLPQVPLDSLFVAVGADWYSATVHFDGVTLLLTGNRREVVHPSLPAAELSTTAKLGAGPLAIEGYRLSRTHQVVSIAFRAFGVAYTLDVECAAPTSDPRCTGDDYAIELAETLAILDGGAP